MKSLRALFLALALPAASFAQTGNQTRFEDKSFWKKLSQDFTFSYYVALMGPSPALPADQTYNVFLEGKAPLQTFHAVNVRYQFLPDWAVGVSQTGVMHHSGPVTTEEGFVNGNENSLFNPQVYVALPGLFLSKATIWHTLAVELSNTEGSKQNNMHYGLVLSQAISLRLPPGRLSAGWLSQVYRYHYRQRTLPPPFPGGLPTPLQTTLVTTGPYVNYQLAPRWQSATNLSFDWDQRGKQTDKWEFNNNLPDRFRTAVNYFFQTKPFTHVGVYLQTLTKPSMDTTIFGVDLSLRF